VWDDIMPHLGHPQAVDEGAGREYSDLLILMLSGDLDKFPFH
jgi:hypothetical protein